MAGRRALFHSDWSGIDPKALPDNFLAICDTPHDWLFPKPDMGLAPGGQMRQQIDEDHFGFEAWDCSHSSRCFVHLCNSACLAKYHRTIAAVSTSNGKEL